MRIRYTNLALKQIASIFAHIAEDNLEAARCVVDRIEGVFRLIGENPRIGRAIRGSRQRRFPVHPYPYLIYYRIDHDEVRITRVRHTARNRPAFHDPAANFRR